MMWYWEQNLSKRKALEAKETAVFKPSFLLDERVFLLLSTISILTYIEFRIDGIEVFTVQMILNDSKAFTKTLIMNDFTCTQEADRFTYLRVLDKPQDIIVGGSGFLFCCNLIRTT